MIKLDGTVPVKYGLRMNADDKYSVVKSKLSTLSGIPTNNLKLTEIIGAQIKVSCYFSLEYKFTIIQFYVTIHLYLEYYS